MIKRTCLFVFDAFLLRMFIYWATFFEIRRKSHDFVVFGLKWDFFKVLVEVLDRCFENVCELDLIFHMDKVHFILNEMIMGGMVLETSLSEIVSRYHEQEKMCKQEIGFSTTPSMVAGALKSIELPNLKNELKNIELPKLPSLRR
ncbi:unnamed protein product [Oikopleura dioica]|uniref:AP complex mu/sigma subunit domain-containing protein n=1 Tax=Oikopleura dioica TaxID=34765 RepID=E4XY31_OIKDI|nr:unnamed protein product [Oikopleura dioica]